MARHAKLVVGTMLVLLCHLSSVADADLMDVWKKIKKAGSSSPDSTRAQLAFMSQLSDQEKANLLVQVGKKLEASSDMDCNIFGGAPSCKALPKDSKFAQFCPNHPLVVDCAYYNEALVDIDEDPVAAMRAEMEMRGDEPCEQCLDNQRELWCAQAVPPCGSFQKHVELAILPAVAEIVQSSLAYDSTPMDQVQMVASAVPKVVQAISLSMPCREMCLAVIQTCNCGQSHTFGYLIKMLREQQQADMDANLAMLPPEMSDAMFTDIWDRELCDLYTPASDPGFSGHCSAEARGQQRSCRWCGDAEMGLFAEFQIADMMAKELFAWVTGPVGLLSEAHEITDESEHDVLMDEERQAFDKDYSGIAEDWDFYDMDDSNDYERKHGGGGGGGKAAVLTVLGLMMVSAAGTGGGYYYFKNFYQARHHAGQESAWAVETGTDYVPMDYEAPVVAADPNAEPSGVL